MENQKYLPEGWSNIYETWNNGCGNIDNRLKEAFEKGLILEGLAVKSDKDYNLIVDLGRVKGKILRQEVCRSTEVEVMPLPIASIAKVNEIIQFKVHEITESEIGEKLILLSRRAVIEEAHKWIFENIEPGMQLKGIVKSTKHYGAFIDIGGGVIALLRVEDFCVTRIRHMNEKLKPGDRINVIVKNIDKETERILLSHKELFGTWEENIKEYQEGTTVVGIARENEKQGIFIELKPNLVGLADYKDGIEYGQNLSVYIKRIIPEKKKIKLVIINKK